MQRSLSNLESSNETLYVESIPPEDGLYIHCPVNSKTFCHMHCSIHKSRIREIDMCPLLRGI